MGVRLIEDRPRLLYLCLGLLHASLSVLAFPPHDQWWWVFLSPFPIALAGVYGSRRPWRAAMWTALGVAPFWAWEMRWAWRSTSAGFVPLVAMLCAYVALQVLVTARIVRSFPMAPLSLVVPVVWAGAEVFRGLVAWNGYPWFLIAHPLIEVAWLASAAAVVGVFGLGVLTCVPAGAACDFLFQRPRRPRLVVGSVAGCALAWTALSVVGWRSVTKSEHHVSVGVVQTNVPQSLRGGWDPLEQLEVLDELLLETDALAADSPDVLVWPETMFPGLSIMPEVTAESRRARLIWDLGPASDAETNDVEDRLSGLTIVNPEVLRVPARDGGERLVTWAFAPAEALLERSRRWSAPLLVGSSALTEFRVRSNESGVSSTWDQRFNSVFLVRDGAVDTARYDKMHLTPFGEVMPYISAWPWLESRLLDIGVGASGMAFDLSAGHQPTIFDVSTAGGGTARIATPICFEATMPGVCRRLVYSNGVRRADVIVQLTNDGWFYGVDEGRLQHLQIARWRAVELGTPVVRAANTGVSAGIDARGRIVRRLRSRESDTLLVTVRSNKGVTPYATLGDAVGWLALSVTVLALVGTFFRRDPRRRADAKG